VFLLSQGVEMVWRMWQKSRGWAGALVGSLLLLSSGMLIAVSAQSGEENVEQEAEETRRALELFLRQERVLFRPGEFAFELGAFYSTDTTERFIDVVSPPPLTKFTTRSGFGILAGRFGLIENLEFDVTIPFGAAEQEVDAGIARDQRDDQGLGDITGSVRYALWPERGARPDVILDVTATSGITSVETLLGTGFWQLGGGVSLVKTLDPVVFFGRLGYSAVLERDGIDPGDQFAYLLGSGFSLNDRVSLSSRVSGIVAGRTQLNGGKIPGSNVDAISMQFAVTTRVTRRIYVEPFVSFGLTEDATDAIVGVSIVGVRFSPFRRSGREPQTYKENSR